MMEPIERARAISAEFRMAQSYARAGNEEGVKSCREEIARLEREEREDESSERR